MFPAYLLDSADRIFAELHSIDRLSPIRVKHLVYG